MVSREQSNNLKLKNGSLTVNRSLKFKDLIKESIDINGKLQGENLICKNITCNRSVDVDGFQGQMLILMDRFGEKNMKCKSITSNG